MGQVVIAGEAHGLEVTNQVAWDARHTVSHNFMPHLLISCDFYPGLHHQCDVQRVKSASIPDLPPSSFLAKPG